MKSDRRDRVKVDLRTVLATRQGTGRIGSVLIHPLLGSHDTQRHQQALSRRVEEADRLRSQERQTLRDLWIVRHSVSFHNGGFVTEPDARRLRSAPLTNKPLLIDSEYLEAATGFLRGIVGRLNTIIGPVVIKHYFERAAARDWTQDQTSYTRLKLITTYVESHHQLFLRSPRPCTRPMRPQTRRRPEQTALKLAQATAPQLHNLGPPRPDPLLRRQALPPGRECDRAIQSVEVPPAALRQSLRERFVRPYHDAIQPLCDRQGAQYRRTERRYRVGRRISTKDGRGGKWPAAIG